MLHLEITNETATRIEKTQFKKLVEKTNKTLKKLINEKLFKRDGQIELIFIDDVRIKAINKEYRKKNAPTDVISFAYLEVTDYENQEGEVIVGDIFISIDTAKKQAKEKGHTLKMEMAILFVHGLLHLFGFDHQTDAEEDEMEGWAKKILS